MNFAVYLARRESGPPSVEAALIRRILKKGDACQLE